MNKLFTYQSGKNGTLIQFCGLYFGLNVWGNCFSPAIVLDTPMLKSRVSKDGVLCHGARWILTLRWANAETKFYWRGGLRFSWDSAHIARRFGVAVEAPHGTCYEYKGWLGNHYDI